MIILKEPKKVKARKIHTCDCCGKKIQIGENYTSSTYVDSESEKHPIYDWHTCDRCLPYVDEAFANKEYDWSDGMSGKDFREYMWEEHRDVITEWRNIK